MQIHGYHPIAFAAMPSGEAFSVAGTSVYWQGILLAAAILVMLLITHLEVRRKRLPGDTAIDLCLVLIPCGVIGARLWYVLTNSADFSGDFRAMLRFWDGGLSLSGAVILALLGLFVYALKKKLPPARLLDVLAPGMIAALGIVRWGDFFAQTGFGPEITDPGRMWFPLAVLIERTDTIHCALFFYEFLWCVLIFLFLLLTVRKRARRDGSAFLWAALLYCAGQAVCNAFRLEPPVSQAARIALPVCGGLAALLLLLQPLRPLPAQAPAEPAESDADAAQDSAPGQEAAACAEEPALDIESAPADAAADVPSSGEEPAEEPGGEPQPQQTEQEK